jgi:hypothetical protein
MSEKKIEGLKVDNKVLEEESQSLERKCNTLELEVEVFREWKRKRDMGVGHIAKRRENIRCREEELDRSM